MHTYLIESMQYVDALGYLDRNIESNPKDTISMLYKAKVLIALWQYDEAIEVFDLIEEVSPNYTDALTERSDLLVFMKEVGIPSRHNEPIGKNTDYSVKALIYQGLANFLRQNYQEAAYFYEMVLKIDPKNVYALFYRGDAFTKLKKYEDAVESYDMALHIDVTNFKDLIFKGVELEKLERYEEAIACYQNAEQLVSDKFHKDTQMIIGNALIKAKRFDDAIAIFDKILNKEPNHFGSRDGKNRADYQKHRDDRQAVPYYR